MSLEWKSYQGREHVYWSAFKQFGNADLVSKFKGTGNGWEPQSFGPFDLEGYSYSAVRKTGQSGKQYFDIERVAKPLGDERPEVIAHKAVQNGDYEKRQSEIAAAHRENIEASKAQTAATNSLAAILAVTNDTLQQLVIIIKDLTEQIQIFNKEKGASFTRASEIKA